MMTPTTFFFRNAGYSYNPKNETRIQGRWRCARDLAAAEQHAARMGWTATWEWDAMEWDGEGPAPHEVLGCVLKNADGEILASLWGIGDPSRDYRRVVEAELAAEARAEIQHSVHEAV